MPAKGPADDLSARARDGEPGPTLRLQGALSQIGCPTDLAHSIRSQQLCGAQPTRDALITVEGVLPQRLSNQVVVELRSPLRPASRRLLRLTGMFRGNGRGVHAALPYTRARARV